MEKTPKIFRVDFTATQFCSLLQYVNQLTESDEPCLFMLRNVLNDKLDAMVRRDAYTTSKTAITEEEREKARIKYLDMKGVPEGFRWSK